jgi:hypothetical protein
MEQKVVKFFDYKPMTEKEVANSATPNGSLKCTIKERPTRVCFILIADNDVDK